MTLEEAGLLLLSLYLFSTLDFAWWIFGILFLAPDVGMAGYLVNSTIGAYTYNVLHHQGLACLCIVTGFWFLLPWLTLTGIIILGHSAMDRIFGYGLKLTDSFRHTHLGLIGGPTGKN